MRDDPTRAIRQILRTYGVPFDEKKCSNGHTKLTARLGEASKTFFVSSHQTRTCALWNAQGAVKSWLRRQGVAVRK